MQSAEKVQGVKENSRWLGEGRAHLSRWRSATLTNALKHNPEALEEVDTVVPGQEIKIKDGTFLRLLWSQQESCKYTWSRKLFKSKTQ